MARKAETPKTEAGEAGGEEKLSFQAEVSRLLHLMVHSVYSEKEIFLRELISNASDACDRLRYAALTKPQLLESDAGLKIEIETVRNGSLLKVADNGIGMSRDELIDNLGTIARSGTLAFVDQLTGDDAGDVSQIGQFGIGFYSSFMVAGQVDVISRSAGQDQAWRWTSDGLGEFTVSPAERDGHGTTVVLHLRKDARDFLDAGTLRRLVKTYSDHVAIPILLKAGAKAAAGEGDGEAGPKPINTASALWARPKKEITAEQYKEFYHHAGHMFDEPWLTLHYRAEGKIEYTVLLFIPSVQPLDLFEPDRKSRLRLYVRRVFITDDCDELIPPYLRFLRGIVDSEDLPLNISREMLQNNPVAKRIRNALTKRVLSELRKKADKDAEGYGAFWKTFGAVLKEGIYEDRERREELLKLARFHSTTSAGAAAGEGAEKDALISLEDYTGRMKEGQDAIYYITGDELEAVRRSPQLEGFVSRGIEVLLLTDPVDDFWITAVPGFGGHAFRSVTRAGDDLSRLAGQDKAKKGEKEAAPDQEIATLIALLKTTLEDSVKDVRVSTRLTDSPVCLVADEGDMDIHLERLLKKHQGAGFSTPRVLEVNPRHELIKTLAKRAGKKGAADDLADAAWLLFDQARILDGEPASDPAAFARRLSALMLNGIKP